MKVKKLFKEKKYEGLEELKLSVIIHVAVLLVLTVIFVFKAEARPEAKKVVPVKLISPAVKPRVASGKKPEKLNQAQKARGENKKLVKKTKKKPAPVKSKKIVKKTTAPKTQAKAKVPATKKNPEQKKQVKKAAQTPVKTETPATTVKPAVVQKKSEPTAPVRPVHNSPTFESVGYLANNTSKNTEINSEIAGFDMGAPMETLMPDSFLDQEKEMSRPEDFTPAPTGTEDGLKPDASGLFEIGKIESFGGNGESFTAPGIVRRVLPEYPDWARKEGAHGSAVYRVLIQQSGTVGDVVTMSSTIDPKLAINGAQALRRWVFTPVLMSGEPQETWVKITVQYKLN
jgi:TonB family protein